MKLVVRCFCLLLIVLIAAGCAHRRFIKLPPVMEGWSQPSAGKNAYIVQKKDTLYSIAWAFGRDYRDLAKINNLNPPYSLRSGQHLYIGLSKTTKNNYFSKSSFIHASTNISLLKGWFWPTRGAIVAKFNNKSGGNKGIDIKGNYGDPILASNSGIIVYSGTGIRSYGKLIIIKHNNDYLSAYAHNSSILVHEGQKVSARQKIATMGSDDAGNVRLHFEIRLIGKPVNPLLYLPKKS